MVDSKRGLWDQLGRRIDNLRISVTDRCNLRCTYCMPAAGLEWLEKGKVLTFEEIERLARVFIGLGVDKIRLTGGEPLVRRELPVLVEKLCRLPGLRDLSLTTNGVLLADQAAALRAAGLRRINVSLDSLVRETYQEIVRRDLLAAVLRGLEAAAEHFEGPVKVNAVLVRGVNDHEVAAFAELARRRGFEVRFIEFMPLDADKTWSRDKVVSGAEVRERILASGHELIPDPAGTPSSPSRDWVFADGAPGKIGFIDSVSAPFCDQCNRVRLTADGKLRTCLFSLEETELLGILRDPGWDEETADRELGRAIVAAVWRKEPGHKINHADFVRSSRTMSQIGG